MSEIICKGCAHYRRTPIAVNDVGGGAYETACGLGKEDEFFTEEGCGEYVPAEDMDIVRVKHGRLIDADALMERDLGGEPYKSVIRRILMQAPTIIEAEEGEE